MSFTNVLRRAIVLATGLATACADSVRPTDAAPDGDAARDAVSFDAPMGCGDAFVQFTYRVDNAAPETVCAPLEGGGIRINYVGAPEPPPGYCMITSFEVEAQFGGQNRVLLGLTTTRNVFAVTGPTPLDFVLDLGDGRYCDPRVAQCGYGSGSDACRFEVVRAGERGAIVAARLATPCVLRAGADTHAPPHDVTLSNAFVQGPLIHGSTFVLVDGGADPCR